MKILSILILFLAFGGAYGQLPERATLVDEMSHVNCDELLARIDYFYAQIRNDPTMKGVVVISGSNDDLLKKLNLEVKFKSAIAQPGSGLEPIPIIRAIETGETKMSFILLPSNVALPESKKWDLTVRESNKSAAFQVYYGGVCSYSALNTTISELIASNPKMRVNVVIYAQRRKDYFGLEKQVRSLFSSKEGKRMRFFRKRSDYEFLNGDVEYWLLP